jgi:copper transport protein
MSRRLAALAVLLGTLLGAGFVLAGAASAHASVVTSDPADGARLASAPAAVTVTFDEPVGLGSIGYLHVTDSSGRRVDAGAAYHPGGDGAKVAQRLRSGLGDGAYVASFRVVSADSHPVAGSVRFVLGNGALGAGVVNPATVDRATSVVFDVARWVSYAGLALLGGSWLLLTVWPQGRDDRRARRIVWTGLGGAAVGATAELLLQGPYTAGRGLSHAADWSLLDGTLHTGYGQYHCARLLLLGLSALLLSVALERLPPERPAAAERFAVLLGVGLTLTFSAVGHAATTAPDPLSITADLLHVSAMATWAGGLVVLGAAVLPRGEPAELRAVLPVFSRVAFAAVTVLAVTGSYAAWRGVGTLHAVFSTTYGRLVVVKVALFVGVLLLGNLSRRAVQRRFARLPVAYAFSDAALEDPPPAVDEPDEAVATERMRRSVLAELALALAVLVATAVLVAQPRGKEAVAIAQQRPVSGVAPLGGGRTATVTIEPGRHGLVSATVELSRGPHATAVTASATLPARQLGPIPLRLTANGADLYGAGGIDLPAAGNWVISLVVTTSEFDAVATTATVHLH